MFGPCGRKRASFTASCKVGCLCCSDFGGVGLVFRPSCRCLMCFLVLLQWAMPVPQAVKMDSRVRGGGQFFFWGGNPGGDSWLVAGAEGATWLGGFILVVLHVFVSCLAKAGEIIFFVGWLGFTRYVLAEPPRGNNGYILRPCRVDNVDW